MDDASSRDSKGQRCPDVGKQGAFVGQNRAIYRQLIPKDEIAPLESLVRVLCHLPFPCAENESAKLLSMLVSPHQPMA